MAVKYKTLKAKAENTPLTNEELDIVDSVESIIDKKIGESFGFGYSPWEVNIELGYFNFSYEIKEIGYNPGKHKEQRKSKMSKELKRRYKKAGWKLKAEYDDGLDGPNMSGPDYMVFRGKE